MKLAGLIRLLVTFVGIRNLNRPTDMCKFKSSQKDESRPVGRFPKAFTLQCFPNCVPRHTGVPLKRLKCAAKVL